jgi:DNA-binding PadR family transcriptional regulator
VSKETRRSPLAMVVLAHLAEAPMHVYRMQQLIKERAKDTVVNVAQRNSLYQTIARLERDGLVRAQPASKQQSPRERVVYELTPAGRSTLHRWLERMLAVPAREFPEFPAALAFLALLSPRRVRDRLDSRRAELSRRLAASRATFEGATAAGLPRLFLLEDEYRNAMTEAELAWLETVIGDLKDGELTWNLAWIREVARRMGSTP